MSSYWLPKKFSRKLRFNNVGTWPKITRWVNCKARTRPRLLLSEQDLNRYIRQGSPLPKALSWFYGPFGKNPFPSCGCHDPASLTCLFLPFTAHSAPVTWPYFCPSSTAITNLFGSRDQCSCENLMSLTACLRTWQILLPVCFLYYMILTSIIGLDI